MFLCFLVQISVSGIGYWIGGSDTHYAVCRPIIRFIFFMTGIKITAHGADQEFSHPSVFCANHQSLLDILVIVMVLPVRVAFVAKSELFKIPILAVDLRIHGHYPIHRTSLKKAKRDMDAIADGIRNGRSILFFPEGTRSENEALLPFKRGPFQIAAGTGAPIVPIHISGTNVINPKTSWLLRRHPITVRIASPILPMPSSTADSLMAATFNTISNLALASQNDSGSVGGK